MNAPLDSTNSLRSLSILPYRTKLWRITTIRQVFFANIPNEARGHAVCVVNVRHVKQGT